jgi:hypothetical protein
MGRLRELPRNKVLESRELRDPCEIAFVRVEMPIVDITWQLQNKIRELEAGRLIDGIGTRSRSCIRG